MSRLEEALKRADPESGAPSAQGTEGTLDAYVVEQPAARPEDSPVNEPQGPADEPVRDIAGPGGGPFHVLTSPDVASKVVVGSEIPPLSVEQYRRLAAYLHHAQADRGLKVVMVASALPGEGKTLTASNLALTLSESYQRRVLLVDADLRRPSIHQVFSLPNMSGLTDGLRAVEPRKLTVVEVSPQLSVLPAGRPDPDPMSVLTSERMQQVLDEARDRFDWVIVDTPPVGLLPDAHLLAAMVDGTLLVVRAGATPARAVTQATHVIGRERLLGVVLNRVDEASLSHGGYYYSYYERNR